MSQASERLVGRQQGNLPSDKALSCPLGAVKHNAPVISVRIQNHDLQMHHE
jgi:hypothetical protein